MSIMPAGASGWWPVTLLGDRVLRFNLYGFGLALAAFFRNLILTSWAVGVSDFRRGDAQRQWAPRAWPGP